MSEDTMQIFASDIATVTSSEQVNSPQEGDNELNANMRSMMISNTSELFELCPEMYEIILKSLAEYTLRDMREHQARMKRLMKEGRNTE